MLKESNDQKYQLKAERIFKSAGGSRRREDKPIQIDRRVESIYDDSYRQMGPNAIETQKQRKRRINTSQQSRATLKIDINSRFWNRFDWF